MIINWHGSGSQSFETSSYGVVAWSEILERAGSSRSLLDATTKLNCSILRKRHLVKSSVVANERGSSWCHDLVDHLFFGM